MGGVYLGFKGLGFFQKIWLIGDHENLKEYYTQVLGLRKFCHVATVGRSHLYACDGGEHQEDTNRETETAYYLD